MPDLSDYLADSNPEGWSEDEIATVDSAAEESAPRRFRIEDDSAAAWALRKLRRAEHARERNIQIAEQEVERIDAWLVEANASHQRDAKYFRAILTDYALRCRQNPDDGRKTISLPAGQVATRTGSAQWKVEPETFLPWAKQNRPDLIRVSEQPILAAIKESLQRLDGIAVDSTGEVVPGVSVSDSETSVTIKPTTE